MAPSPQYPHQDGDVTVLGPELIASADGQTIGWRGENYVRQDALVMPILTGPSLLYTGSVDNRGLRAARRIDQEAMDVDDPRERALCRALLCHALALLDATEPTHPAPASAAGVRRV